MADRKHYTIESIEEIVRGVMKEMGITDHLPSTAEIQKHSKLAGSTIVRYGGMTRLSKRMGLPLKSRKVPPRYKKRNSARDKDFISKDEVKPSQAFRIQAETGKPWGEIQAEQSLEMAGKIDISKYEGLQTYAERIANG